MAETVEVVGVDVMLLEHLVDPLDQED